MKLLVLSDIHGNLAALTKVIEYTDAVHVDAVALLGDLIDYCPHSNEVVEIIQNTSFPIACNIWGNHEDAILTDDYTRFSSPRGAESARHTKSILTAHTIDYLYCKMSRNGTCEFSLKSKKFLAVHGTLEDCFWGKFDMTKDLSAYANYDVVLMGHSHQPLFYEKYFPCANEATRNKKKTVFINPGSVGQPRNLNPNAQFVIFDTETESADFVKVSYNIAQEQKDFSDRIDSFYKTRLEAGI